MLEAQDHGVDEDVDDNDADMENVTSATGMCMENFRDCFVVYIFFFGSF